MLQISPAQWIFQNVSIHDNTTGYLCQQQWQEVLSEVDWLSQINPLKVPASSIYLLEIDFSSFHNNNIKDQSYWLFATRAACKAGRWVAIHRRSNRHQYMHPTTTTDTHNLSSGDLSQCSHTTHLDTQCTPRQWYVTTGATITLRAIELDWNDRQPPTQVRPHLSSSDLLVYDSCSRWPDQSVLHVCICSNVYMRLHSFNLFPWFLNEDSHIPSYDPVALFPRAKPLVDCGLPCCAQTWQLNRSLHI